jgi:hypothetical protein
LEIDDQIWSIDLQECRPAGAFMYDFVGVAPEKHENYYLIRGAHQQIME